MADERTDFFVRTVGVLIGVFAHYVLNFAESLRLTITGRCTTEVAQRFGCGLA